MMTSHLSDVSQALLISTEVTPNNHYLEVFNEEEEFTVNSRTGVFYVYYPHLLELSPKH